MLKRRLAAAMVGPAVTEDARRLKYEDLEAALFEDYRTNGRRTLRDLPRVVARLRLAFAGMRALDITTARMRAYTVSRLDEEGAPATINKELAALGRMLSLAFRDGRLPRRPAVPKLQLDNARTGFLEPEDFAAFCAELPEVLQPVATFGYLTGWRKGEILGLQWRQVDLKGGTIRLEAAQSKNRQGRVLAFAPDSPLADVLRAQGAVRRLDCPYVFHRNGRQIRDFYCAWRAAAARAGRPNLMLHDFRRSSVRNMVRAGVSERVAMARSGHKTRSVFDRYDIVSEVDLRDADRKVGTYLMGRRQARVRAIAGRTEAP